MTTKNEPSDFEQTFHPIKVGDVKKGTVLAFINYTVVEEVGADESKVPGTMLKVRNLDTGVVIDLKGKGLIENARSADFYAEEVVTSQTNLIDILMSSYNIPFTVVYDKQDGTERTLRGRMIKPDTRRGRSDADDLDKEIKNRYRQIDHRTLKSIIVGGVKYKVK